jgi:hypothetical protein
MAESVRKQLEHLRDQTNADSLAEVIRRALAVYDLLRKTAFEGGKIILENPGRRTGNLSFPSSLRHRRRDDRDGEQR